jgi:hypothetical protein
MGVGEEVVNKVFVGVRRGVVDEGIDLGGGGGEAEEVEVKAADEDFFWRVGRKAQVVLLEFLEEEGVDGG